MALKTHQHVADLAGITLEVYTVGSDAQATTPGRLAKFDGETWIYHEHSKKGNEPHVHKVLGIFYEPSDQTTQLDPLLITDTGTEAVDTPII